MNKKLIALYPILFEARQYNIGDELPVNNVLMVEKWLSAETAEWRNVEPKAEFNKEYYEKLIAELKEKHNDEIVKLKSENEELHQRLEEYTNFQSIGDLDLDVDTNESELEAVQEESSQNKKKSSRTKK
ncbi:hypothetical protein ACQPUL_08420 [Clostridium butyricum]|uniref:hypothetical protein n=1 Tax=Clostridium butyricum TaxID=1492 RepID=UPI003D32CFEF